MACELFYVLSASLAEHQVREIRWWSWGWEWLQLLFMILSRCWCKLNRIVEHFVVSFNYRHCSRLNRYVQFRNIVKRRRLTTLTTDEKALRTRVVKKCKIQDFYVFSATLKPLSYLPLCRLWGECRGHKIIFNQHLNPLKRFKLSSLSLEWIF